MLNLRLLKECSYKKIYKLVLVLVPIFNAIFIAVSAFMLSKTVDGVFLKHRHLNDIIVYMAGFLINAILKGIFNYFMEVYIKNSADDISNHIKKTAFDSIVESNPYLVKQQKLGEVINSLTEGIELITPYFSQYIPQFLTSVILPIVLCLSAIFIDKWSALIMVLTYPLIPMFMILIGSKSKQLNEAQWKKLAILSSHFIDMLQGITTLKVFGRSKIQERKVFEVSEGYREATMKVLRISFLSALVLELFSTLSIAFIAVNLGLRLVYGKIEFFNAFYILIMIPEFYLAVRNLGLRFHASLNGNVAIEKIDNLAAKVKYDKNESQKDMDLQNISEIEIKNLVFSYEDKETLKEVSFSIRKGEKVALIGQSGSGKSTLINILSGFIRVPEGMVLINGRDINSFSKDDYIKQLSLVPQSPHLFNKSIKDNILLGAELKAEFEEICKLTKVDEIASNFVDEYNTIVGEGEKALLSGGEVQRISLARALYKNSSFIIMDEPSSALDPISENLFTDMIMNHMQSRTMLISAHRLNTIRSVDRIIVLDDGVIAEEGNHEELMKIHGKYYELINAME